MSIEAIKLLCTKYGIVPSKKFGQNFVIDERVLRMMVDYAELEVKDDVVEIGPGLGALTMELVKRAKKVVAVEVDKKMYRAAQEILAGFKNVELVQGDVLSIPNSQFLIPNVPYKVVANLPYSITSAVLRKFTEQEPRPTRIVVMVQKEVAERVCARPGDMSILSVAIQYYGQPEVIAIVPRTAFWPEPEVDSAILRIAISNTQFPMLNINEKRLFQLVRVGFSSRRKQLRNNLMAGLKLPREVVSQGLNRVGLGEQIRAQELSVDNWIALAQVL